MWLFPLEILVIRREWSSFVHEVSSVFIITIFKFHHIHCWWNDDNMPSFIQFRDHLNWLTISGSCCSKMIHLFHYIYQMNSKLFEILGYQCECLMPNTHKKWRLTDFGKTCCLCNVAVSRRNPDISIGMAQFCTQSTTSFYYDTLKFIQHTVLVKQWQHAKSRTD